MPSRLRFSFVCLCLAAAQVRGQESQAPTVDLHSQARITQPAPIPAVHGRLDPSWPTPSGAFVVDVLERHPTWNVPASILEESRRRGRIQPAVVPPGPDNPLGEFWIGLSRSGLGIHGTNVPSSIFGAVSHGCVRVHPDDIARLFGRTRVGALGRIIYDPVLLSVVNDTVYLEVHRDVYGRGGATARELATAAGVFEQVDWTVADIVSALRDGIARDVTRRR
jgi:L,D-transpeptidase ErfK/SrfK